MTVQHLGNGFRDEVSHRDFHAGLEAKLLDVFECFLGGKIHPRVN
jgi:hypothetical protein